MVQCSCCHLDKEEEDYHRIELGIVGEEAKKSLLVDELCKDCLKLEDVHLMASQRNPIDYKIINRESYSDAIRENYIKNVLGADISDFYDLREMHDLFKENSLTRIIDAKNFKDNLKILDKKGLIDLILVPYVIDGSVNKYHCKKDEIDEYIQHTIKTKRDGILVFLNRHILSDEQLDQLDTLKDSGFLFNKNNKLYIRVDYVNEQCPCKICCKVKNFSEFRQVSRGKSSLYQCRECESIKQRSYYSGLSPEEKERHINAVIKWQKDNPEKRRAMERRRRKQPKQRIYHNIRKRLRGFLKTKNNNFNKDIGCTRAELVAHIESQFQENMTWENYGVFGWHIDHIMPLSKFEGKSPNHYTNLQPLWAKDNIEKSNKIEEQLESCRH